MLSLTFGIVTVHDVGSLVRMFVVFQMADLQQEHHREIEGLLENIRQLSRELRLQMLIIDNFIPQEYQVCVCAHARALSVKTLDEPHHPVLLACFRTTVIK